MFSLSLQGPSHHATRSSMSSRVKVYGQRSSVHVPAQLKPSPWPSGGARSADTLTTHSPCNFSLYPNFHPEHLDLSVPFTSFVFQENGGNMGTNIFSERLKLMVHPESFTKVCGCLQCNFPKPFTRK